MLDIPLGPWTLVDELGESSQSTRSSCIEKKPILTWPSVSLKDLVNNQAVLGQNAYSGKNKNMPMTARISTTEVVV